MSEREQVLAKASFDVMERYVDRNGSVDVFRMCDRIAELENEKRNKDVWSVVRNALRDAVDKHNAATKYEALSAELDELARNVESALLASITPPPAPRVVVLDGFRTMNRFTVIGASVFDTVAQATSWLRHLDEEFPNQAPHRVVRVALVAEEALTEAPADGA
jgi:hypothetical protein